ncbi:uncharacterized protein [Elaeis guineensis]|uniref:Uncharacterized protein LOC105041391 n=1 Tax=Elaeis guineensis var. tenera TaxID=51953 RepID=A0A6I9QWY4_ELAGV|nr:uncharacterized protein LOC105041391 [Elaeis guineensis]
MEVVVPMAPGQDFHFQSASTSPYVSAPSSPKPFGNPSDCYFYASAPTSPSRAAAVYAHFFDWEDKPSRPKPDDDDDDGEFDFAVGFDRQLQKKGPTTNLAAADELFENGRIRPLKPPPHLHHPIKDDTRGTTWQGGGGLRSPQVVSEEKVVKDRGRTPSTLSTTRAGSRRGSRSLSPIRGDGDFHKSLTSSSSSSTTTTTTTSSLIRSGGSKKWRLKDLLLFRSASEGRVIGRGSKDPLRKYTMLSSSRSLLPSLSNKRRSSGREDAKNSGSKPGDKNGSVRRGSSQAATSAHEVHYTTNRAVSEELKKKTPLPFNRHGLFGCLSFNPAIRSITRGFGSHSFSRGKS